MTTKDNLKIVDKWELPLTRMQIEELDKMVDFYSREYKQKESLSYAGYLRHKKR